MIYTKLHLRIINLNVPLLIDKESGFIRNNLLGISSLIYSKKIHLVSIVILLKGLLNKRFQQQQFVLTFELHPLRL